MKKFNLKEHTSGRALKRLRAGVVSFLLMSLWSSVTLAEVSIIVHPSNQASISEKDIKNIFLSKTRTFSNGTKVVPIVLPIDDITLEDFAKNYLKKSPNQLKAYWSKLVFAGLGTPPKTIENEEKIIDLVSNNPNFIGIINSASANASVKALQF
jgi:hypothetical protein